MSRLDFHKTEVFLDGLNQAKIKVILRDVKTTWPVHGSQSDTTARHFEAIELLQNFNDDKARVFLRECAVSRPHRAMRWPSLKGVA